MIKRKILRLTCLLIALTVCLVTPACRPHKSKNDNMGKADASLSADRKVLEKLKGITIPRFYAPPSPDTLPLVEIAKLLYTASRDYDDPGISSEQRGVRFAVRLPRATEERKPQTPPDPFDVAADLARLHLTPELAVPSGSLLDSLTFVCKAFNMEFTIKNGNVIVAPKGSFSSAMKTPPILSPSDCKIIEKLKKIVIPECVFRPPADLIDAVDFFHQASCEYDWENDPIGQRGVKIALRLPNMTEDYSTNEHERSGEVAGAIEKTSSFVVPNIRNCSLYDLLVLVCDAAGMAFGVYNGTVIIMTPEGLSDLFLKEKATTPRAAVANISEEHTQQLCQDMEKFISNPATFQIGWYTDAGASFRKQCEAYAKTNAIPFNDVILLMLEKIAHEYDDFKNDTPLDNDKVLTRLDRCDASIKMIRSLNNPVTLPFLYRMARERGRFQNIFIDMYNDALINRPVSEIQQALNDPVLGRLINLPELWEEIHQRMCSAINNPNHVCAQTGERLDELMPFVIDYLPKISDPWRLLSLETTLAIFWPEYRISVQRNAIWKKIKNFESSGDLTGGKKKMEEDFKNAPREGFRLDLRKKYNTLPPSATERMLEKK